MLIFLNANCQLFLISLSTLFNDGYILAKEALESGQTEKKFIEILKINAELARRYSVGMN